MNKYGHFFLRLKSAAQIAQEIFQIKARFHYERGKKHSLFVLLLFFALASILTARFNRRSIKERKNALFHARSGNGPLRRAAQVAQCFFRSLMWAIPVYHRDL